MSSSPGAGLRRGARLFWALLFLSLGLVLAGTASLLLCNLGQTDLVAVRTLASRSWFWRSVWLSLVTAGTSTLLAVALGLPTAYALSRLPGLGWAGGLLDVVLVLPASTVGLVLMVALQYPPVLALQEALGGRVVHSLAGVVLAQLVLALAFAVRAFRAAFDAVDPRCEQVARSLGSSRARTFFTVTLPQARHGFWAGVVLAFTRALAEFGGVLLVAGTFRLRDAAQFPALARALGLANADVLSVAMWMEFEGGRAEQGVAIAFVLILVSFVSVYLLHRLAASARPVVSR